MEKELQFAFRYNFLKMCLKEKKSIFQSIKEAFSDSTGFNFNAFENWVVTGAEHYEKEDKVVISTMAAFLLVASDMYDKKYPKYIRLARVANSFIYNTMDSNIDYNVNRCVNLDRALVYIPKIVSDYEENCDYQPKLAAKQPH